MANARNKKALGEGTQSRLQDMLSIRTKAIERKIKWRAVERIKIQALHAIEEFVVNCEIQTL